MQRFSLNASLESEGEHQHKVAAQVAIVVAAVADKVSDKEAKVAEAVRAPAVVDFNGQQAQQRDPVMQAISLVIPSDAMRSSVNSSRR